jgi:hypothetical protein
MTRIKDLYIKHLNFTADDMAAIDMVISTIITLFHPQLTEPVWLYISSPPGSGKTELILPMKAHPRCVFISGVTENAFLSGHVKEDGSDPSLIGLINNKMLIIKDLTTWFGQDPRKMSKILGDLRDAFDGFCAKPSGTAGLRQYDSHFGMIAAVTDAIDTFSEQFQQLGERFLTVRLKRLYMNYSDRIDYLLHVRRSMPHKALWRAELTTAVCLALDEINTYIQSHELPYLSPEQEQQVCIIADVLALLRTCPVGGIATEPEVASRLTQQLISVGHAHACACLRDHWNEEEIHLIKRIVIDTLPLSRRRVIMTMYFLKGVRDSALTLNQISNYCPGVPSQTVNNMMGQFIHNRVVEKVHGYSNTVMYKLTDDAYNHLKSCSLFEPGDHLPPLPLSLIQSAPRLQDLSNTQDNGTSSSSSPLGGITMHDAPLLTSTPN